jgi:hypothetical protein
MTAAKRLLRYLKCTSDYRLHYGINIDLVRYSDSDWANDSADRKSQGGHVFQTSSGAISWQSRKQDLIAMSTLEAEYIACSEASREAKWFIQLWKDIQGVTGNDTGNDTITARLSICCDKPGRSRSHHYWNHQSSDEAYRRLLPQQSRSP